MKANTKVFNQLANFINNQINVYDEKITLQSVYSCLQDTKYEKTFLNVNEPINIIYTKKTLKPADIKNYYNSYNASVVYFITQTQYKGCRAIYYMYCFDGEKTKEKKLFSWCYWAYDSEAKNRANANNTIIILQDKKYYEMMEEKRTVRTGYYNYYYSNNNVRYSFLKDFFNEYSEPEKQQRYKYIVKDYPKIELENNLYLSEKYKLKPRSSRLSYKSNYIVFDKSGYITTYKQNDLKERAIELKEKRLTEAFKSSKQEKYLVLLQDTKKKLEQAILKAYQKASSIGLNNVLLLNSLYNDRLKDITEKIDHYIYKLQFEKYNNNIIEFESGLLKVINFNLLDIIKEYNIYLNFQTIYNKIAEPIYYNGLDDLLKKYDYDVKYKCLVNIYNQQKHTIKNNRLYFLNDSIDIKNYYSFINTPDEV